MPKYTFDAFGFSVNSPVDLSPQDLDEIETNWMGEQGIKKPSLPTLSYKKPGQIPTPNSRGFFQSINDTLSTPLIKTRELPGKLPTFSSGRGLDAINPSTAKSIAEEMTTPYSLAGMAAGPLGKAAPLAGNILGKGVGVLQTGAGLQDLSQGNIGEGLWNTAFGGLGVLQKYGKMPIPESVPEPTPEFPVKLFKRTVEKSETPAQVMGANRISYRGSTPLPPQSTGVPDVVVPKRLKPVTSGEAAFNAMIPERYKPKTEVWEGMPTDIPSNAGPSGVEVIPKQTRAIEKIVEIPAPITKLKSEAETGKITQSTMKQAREIISPLSWKDRFEDWVFARNAADYEGLQKKKDFSDLDKMGIQGIFEIQSGNNLKGVREYFNKKFQDVKTLIPDTKYRENYLPQLWSNTPEEIDMVFGKKKLSLRPSFTLERVIQDYQTGIDKGLKPKFDKVSDLVGWYEQRANKAIADREMYNYLKEAKLIKPTPKAPRDWLSLDSDTFPLITGNANAGTTWSAHPDVAKAVNTFLMDDRKMNPLQKALQFTGETTSHVKNVMLTGGIPKTGLNWHTAVSTPTRALVSDGIGRMLKNYYYDVVPGAAKSYLDDNLDTAIDAVKHGMGLGVEGFWANSLPQEKGIGRTIEGWFSDAAFKEILPAIKLQTWQKTWQSFAAKGMNIKEAKKAAAKFTNNAYGGIQNPERHRDVQNFLRTALLAPDWAETKLNLGKEAVKALRNPKDPVGQKYLKTVAGMLGLFISEAALGTSVRNGIPSSSSRLTNIPMGTVEGKDAEFVPSGTALDTVGIPIKAGINAAKGDPTSLFKMLGNQSSPFMQLGGDLYSGEDALGNPLRNVRLGDNATTRELLLNNISNIMGYITPQPVQAGVDLATKRIGPREALTTATELPVRFYRRK